MVGKKEIRNYEVSVWTLQDSFITVLKPSNLENKGQIMDGSMTLKDDGDNKLSFKIPMYIRNNKGELIENHLWHNTINGIIISGLRKIKVIFNKNTEDEAVYEFVIVDVNESHEGRQQYCQVDCEGLAFHELGKQGFKISLEGADEIDRAQKSFIDNPEESGFSTLPIGNLNYWADRVFEGSNWRYSIQMDWSAQDGITYQEYALPSGVVLRSTDYENFTEEEKIQFNILRSQDNSSLWRRNKIYEEPFITSWRVADNETNLQPTSIKEQEEKIRMIEGKESNRYNLSQSVAEMFQVFCRYKYYYDENYHIVDREAIFYNNFLNEFEGVIDLTYSYNTQHLTRNMDSKDVVSKMYVAPLTDGDSPSGQTYINDTSANRSLEDYILNFDYLYDIGTITQEQYDAIAPFEAKMRLYNEQLTTIANNLIPLQAEKITQEATKKTAEDSKTKSLEEIDKANDLKMSLTKGSGMIPVPENDPQTWPMAQNREGSKKFFCNVRTEGIDRSTLHIYRRFNSTTREIDESSEIKEYGIEEDQYGNLTRITNLTREDGDDSLVVYAVFKYSPQLHYQNIINLLTEVAAKNERTIERTINRLTELEEIISNYEKEQQAKLKEKQEEINKFERLMGSALREGKWQPEDEYTGYGEPHDVTLKLTNQNATNSSSKLLSLIWDDELFDDEQKCNYEYGITQDIKYYPCIIIDQTILNTFTFEELNQNLSFVYIDAGNDVPEEQLDDYKKHLIINSKMVFGFLQHDGGFNEVVPIIMLNGIEGLDNNTSERVRNGYLTIITTSADSTAKQDVDGYKIVEDPDKIVTNLNWAISPLAAVGASGNMAVAYKTVYPRFKIDSNTLRSPQTTITVDCEGTLLSNYQDYYIFSRDMGYLVTIKPHVIFSALTSLVENWSENWVEGGVELSIYFVVSTAALAIYLDAVKVAKENAYPKVSYEIDIASVNENFSHKLYARLGQIAHINDAEFKFENTMGYISEVTLDLDRPWQDKVIIKNYKTKFEDLFSTIVAETEQMQKNAAAIGIAAGAFHSDGTLDESIFAPFLQRVLELTTVEVPTPESVYLEVEPYIRALLRNTYEEAGEILEAANESVAAVNDLNIQNSEILALYRENVRQNLTPQTFKLGDFDDNGTITTYNKRYNASLGVPDTVNFKVGDILEYGYQMGNEYIVDTYVATEHSSQVIYELNDDKSSSLKGWSLLKDGSLAQIKGANLDINADAGIISILAENELNVASGGKLKLAGENVQIVGNNLVNISGPTINLSSVYSVGNTIEDTEGIHLLVTATDENGNADTTKPSINAVDITSKGVAIAAAEGIQMKAGRELNFYSSSDTNTSVISISESKGIYLGSNQKIVFYSGPAATATTTTPKSSASMEISPSRILFGITEGASGTVVDISQNSIILGASNNFQSNKTWAGSIGSNVNNVDTSGILISKEEIKIATQPLNQNHKNIISMNNNGIIISTSDSNNNGAFVQVSKGGVLIGTAPEPSTESPFVTTIKSRNAYSGSYNGAKFQVYAPNFVVTDQGKLYAYDAYIAGTIYANGGQIGNWSLTDGYLCSSDSKVGLAVDYQNTNISFWAGSNSPENAPFRVTNTGNVTAESGSIGGWNINSNSISKDFILNNQQIGSVIIQNDMYDETSSVEEYKYNPVFLVYYNGKNKFYVRSNGKLYAEDAEIKGAITATSLKIGEQGIDDYIAENAPQTSIPENYATLTVENGYLNLSSTEVGNNGINSQSAVKISKDKIYLDSTGTFEIKSGNFIVDNAGNVRVTGAITATSLTLSSGATIAAGSVTGLSNVATSGSYSDLSGTPTIPDYSYMTVYFQNGILTAGTPAEGQTGFQVSQAGLLQAANAIIYGKIYSSEGLIGNWNINNTSIYKNCILSGENTDRVEYYQVFMNSDAYSSSNEIPYNPMFGVYYSKFDDTQNSRIYDFQFYVRSNGELYAKNANIQGTITATSGTIGGCAITGGQLTIDSAHISGELRGKTITGSSLHIYNEDNQGIYQGPGGITKSGTSAYIDANSIGALQIYANKLAVRDTIQGTVEKAEKAQSLISPPSIQSAQGVVGAISITVGEQTSSSFTIPYAQSAGSAGYADSADKTDSIAVTITDDVNNASGKSYKEIFIHKFEQELTPGTANKYDLNLTSSSTILSVFSPGCICTPYVNQHDHWYAAVTTNSGADVTSKITLEVHYY